MVTRGAHGDGCETLPECSVTDPWLRRWPVAFLADHARNTYLVINICYSHTAQRQRFPIRIYPTLEVFLDCWPFATQGLSETATTPVRGSIVDDLYNYFPAGSSWRESVPSNLRYCCALRCFTSLRSKDSRYAGL